jgi:hypothetical protein
MLPGADAMNGFNTSQSVTTQQALHQEAFSSPGPTLEAVRQNEFYDVPTDMQSSRRYVRDMIEADFRAHQNAAPHIYTEATHHQGVFQHTTMMVSGPPINPPDIRREPMRADSYRAIGHRAVTENWTPGQKENVFHEMRRHGYNPEELEHTLFSLFEPGYSTTLRDYRDLARMNRETQAMRQVFGHLPELAYTGGRTTESLHAVVEHEPVRHLGDDDFVACGAVGRLDHVRGLIDGSFNYFFS